MARAKTVVPKTLKSKRFAIAGKFSSGYIYNPPKTLEGFRYTTCFSQYDVAVLATKHGAITNYISNWNPKFSPSNSTQYLICAVNITEISKEAFQTRFPNMIILDWLQFCRALSYGIDNYTLDDNELRIMIEGTIKEKEKLEEEKKRKKELAQSHKRLIASAKRHGVLYEEEDQKIKAMTSKQFIVDDFSISDKEDPSDTWYIKI
jgi:hypothetical protein